MGKRCPDQELINKMQDIAELIYILNRIANSPYCDDYSREYFEDICDKENCTRDNCDRYRYRDYKRNNDRLCSRQYDRYHCNKEENLLDRIIFFLKSLND